MQRYYDRKRRTINGRIWYWNGWVGDLAEIPNRIELDFEAIQKYQRGAHDVIFEWSTEPHEYAGEVNDVAGWHVWIAPTKSEPRLWREFPA